MKRWTAALLLCALAGCGDSAGLTQEEITQRLIAEANELSSWAADVALLEFVVAQNADSIPLTEVQRRDTEWVAGRANDLVNAVTTGPCSDRLRQLAARATYYGEVLLMDNQGALVCASQKTTDYWQGDEPKWTRTYGNGTGEVFIDRVEQDASSGERIAQISLPMREQGQVIGAITVGIRINRL